MSRTFTRTDELAKYRVEMKRSLRLAGYPVDNDATTEQLEELVEWVENRVFEFNGSKEYNRWYWYSFLMNKIFMEHPNYFTYHIPVWGMNELEYNYNYVFEKFRRR